MSNGSVVDLGVHRVLSGIDVEANSVVRVRSIVGIKVCVASVGAHVVGPTLVGHLLLRHIDG